MIGQEKELAQKRILEERRRVAREIGQNLLIRLEKIKLQAAGATVGREQWPANTNFKSREVVFLGLVDGDRLLLPWETDRKLEESRRLLNQSSFRERIGRAERVEFSAGDNHEAARLYDLAVSKAGEPVQKEHARLLLARVLSRAGRKQEALAKKVFELDVLECDRCGGRMMILAAIHQPEAIRKILECLSLPSRPPPISPAAPDREVFF